MTYVIQGHTLTGIADAIRAQLGTQQQYTPESMAAAIGSIQGVDAPEESILKISALGTGLASVSPSAAGKMQGLTLYGRSWQDGTPSVETEVPIEDTGQSGTVDVTVAGTNLLSEQGVDLFYVNSQGTSVGYASGNAGKLMPVYAGVTYYVRRVTPGARFRLATTIVEPSAIIGFTASAIDKSIGDTSNELSIKSTVNGYLVINLDTAEGFDELMVSAIGFEPYQPYIAQHLPIPTPDGLPGIPVDSGGNWVDENGQQWVSDVVDFETGTKIQRIYKETIPLHWANNRYLGRTTHDIDPSYTECLCNRLVYNKNATNGQIRMSPPYRDTNVVAYSPEGSLTAVEVIYILADPITTPLDSETIAAYKALQSYPGTTNVLAPDCGIEATAYGNAAEYVSQHTAIQDAAQAAKILLGLEDV